MMSSCVSLVQERVLCKSDRLKGACIQCAWERAVSEDVYLMMCGLMRDASTDAYTAMRSSWKYATRGSAAMCKEVRVS